MRTYASCLIVLCAFIAAGTVSAAILGMQVVGDDITGLSDNTRMWDSGTSQPIPWPDSSGNGYDAHGTSIHNAPFYQTAQVDRFNNHAYVGMGDGDCMMGSIPALSGWGFTTVAVGQFENSQTVMSLGDTDGAVGYLNLNLTADGNLTVGSRDESYASKYVTSTGLSLLGSEHLFVVDYRADNDFQVYVDGQPALAYTGTATDPGVTTLDRYGLGVTARSSLTGIGTCAITEARFYTGTWSAGEREAMESALMTTYDIIPEPTTIALALTALVLFVFRRRVA